ncbi:MAG: hypothetical protein MI975_16565 [Cytophagales bacterium]|nr:hypothetical protein [Cytophagales bacterium]
MKSLVVKNGIALGLFLALVVGNAFAAGKAKDLIGTWNYEAPYAPYEYSTGKLIFTENGDKVEGKIKIGEYEIDMRNVKVEGDKVTFGAYVEGEYIKVDATVKKNSLTGTVSYSEGTMEVTGEKEK